MKHQPAQQLSSATQEDSIAGPIDSRLKAPYLYTWEAPASEPTLWPSIRSATSVITIAWHKAIRVALLSECRASRGVTYWTSRQSVVLPGGLGSSMPAHSGNNTCLMLSSFLSVQPRDLSISSQRPSRLPYFRWQSSFSLNPFQSRTLRCKLPVSQSNLTPSGVGSG